MTDNMTPEIKRRIAGVVLAGSAIAAAVGGYAATRGQEHQPANTPTPSAAAASPTPEITPTVTKTPEATPTKTPETVPCQLLPKEVCNLAERLNVKNDRGEITPYLGVKLPPGTLLTSPIDGQTSSTKLPPGGTAQGFFVTILNPDNRSAGSYNLTGDIELPSSGQNIKAGETFGKIGDTGAKSFGEYNLLINISKVDPATNKPVPDEERMKQLFPAAYEKPAKEVSSQGSSGSLIISPVFYGTPQPSKP